MVGWATSVLVASGIDDADELKPRYHQLERRFERLMERLASDGLDYKVEIKIVDHETFWFGHRMWRSYEHRVTIPSQVRRELRAYDWRFREAIFPEYIQDPKYSSIASVLHLASVPQPAGLPVALTPLAEHDEASWSSDAAKAAFVIVREWPGSKHAYWDPLFFESVPARYHETVFPPSAYIDGASVLGHGPFPDEIRKRIEEFSVAGGWDADVSLHLEPKGLMWWLRWVLMGGGMDPDPKDALSAFLAACRQAGGQGPHLAALMMAAFVVDGYEFDDETGEYRPNEMGRRLLDYVVEFPIPENASRLKIVMDGGNREWIEERMRQHGTEEAWREWLADPPKPEFKPFRQLPLEQWKKVYGARADEEFSRARQRDE
jgi:hypothetical protein